MIGTRGTFAGGTLGTFGGPVGQALGGAAGQALGQVLGYPGASGQAPTIAANDPAPAAATPASAAPGAAAPAAGADPAQMMTKLLSSTGGVLNKYARTVPWFLWAIAGAVFMWWFGRRGGMKKILAQMGGGS